jgi:hypothetical protein
MDDGPSPLAIVAKHQVSPPVMLRDIVRDLGLVVKIIPLGQSMAGQITRDPRNGGRSGFVIYVNADDSKTRQKFTLAHEIAHYILHRDLIETGIVDDTMYRSELGSYYETQANQLAADILMPIRLVKVALKKTEDPIELAKMFDVSPQAMKIRLKGMKGRVSA